MKTFRRWNILVYVGPETPEWLHLWGGVQETQEDSTQPGGVYIKAWERASAWAELLVKFVIELISVWLYICDRLQENRAQRGVCKYQEKIDRFLKNVLFQADGRERLGLL